MANRDWGPGEVLSRTVGSRIEGLLPADLATAEIVHFSAGGSLDRETRPRRAEGGIIEITGTVGEESQFSVELELSLTETTGEASASDWTVSTQFSREFDRGSSNLDPFHYDVEWEERIGDATSEDADVVDLADVREGYRFGRREGVAALMLAEILANRRASATQSREERLSHAGSLAMLGSFNTALDNGRIGVPGWELDWQDLAAMFGPDADTAITGATVETGRVSRDRRSVEGTQPVLTGSDGSGVAGPIGEQLEALLEEIGGSESATVPRVELASGDPESTQERLKDRLLEYPDGFPAALDDGNFGVARELAAGWEQPYEKMVMIYAFHELYAAIGQLGAAEDAVSDIAAAITAFRTAIERGDAEMAQLSLKRASDAFVTVTRELVNGAQSRLEALEGLLAYHDLREPFDRQVAKRSDLAGEDLEHYRSATGSLVEAARRQHARSEQAREAYHLYSESR